MRADRLVAALLVLQARGRVTAAGLARELEISERTARRDLEALSMAGIPVYPQPGRNGGWSLVGGARTDLSGLTATEVRALFLLAGPSAATPELRSALRKLVHALPATFRAEAEAAAAAVVLDPTGWDRRRPAPPEHLDELQGAVIRRERLVLEYARRNGTRGQRTVDPLGLVCKRGVWYLVAGTEAGRRTFRVDRVSSLQATGEEAARPTGFDLESTWRESLSQLDEVRLPLVATLRVPTSLVGTLRSVLGAPVEVTSEHDDGRCDVVVRSYSAFLLGCQLAGFGGSVEVLGPESVRAEVRRIAGELAGLYLAPKAPGSPGAS